MDMIALTRELGKAIQQDERYIALQVAKQNSDADETLQSLIQEFNLKRMAINHEATKEDRDEERLQTLNEEMRASYAEIMRNPNMMAYNHAKEGMDAIMKRIQAILTQCAQGVDPETADLDESSCGGSCAGCAGCH